MILAWKAFGPSMLDSPAFKPGQCGEILLRATRLIYNHDQR